MFLEKLFINRDKRECFFKKIWCFERRNSILRVLKNNYSATISVSFNRRRLRLTSLGVTLTFEWPGRSIYEAVNVSDKIGSSVLLQPFGNEAFSRRNVISSLSPSARVLIAVTSIGRNEHVPRLWNIFGGWRGRARGKGESRVHRALRDLIHFDRADRANRGV